MGRPPALAGTRLVRRAAADPRGAQSRAGMVERRATLLERRRDAAAQPACEREQDDQIAESCVIGSTHAVVDPPRALAGPAHRVRQHRMAAHRRDRAGKHVRRARVERARLGQCSAARTSDAAAPREPGTHGRSGSRYRCRRHAVSGRPAADDRAGHDGASSRHADPIAHDVGPTCAAEARAVHGRNASGRSDRRHVVRHGGCPDGPRLVPHLRERRACLVLCEALRNVP